MSSWYKKELIRNLVDMHIPNGDGYLEKFDPAVYAENIKKSGATVAYIYGSNCLGLCFYPTKIGLRHTQAQRDIFGETVKECRKRGLKVVGYLNSWGSFVCDEHPQWAVRFASGKSKRDTERVGNPCVINKEYQDYFTSLVYEFVSSYKLDGLWVDMIGIWAPVCYCDACKEQYKGQLPSVVDLNDPGFAQYHRWRGERVYEYAQAIKSAAKRADPDITISLQGARVKNPFDSGLNDLRYYKIQDYLAGDFYMERTGVNVISRLLYRLSDNLPFEFMVSRCVSLERHTMNKDINELIVQSYAAFMYKGAFLFIDAIDPDGEMNSEFYDDISVISKNLKPYFEYADFDEKPIREIAVLYNFYSGVFAKQNGKPIDEMKGVDLINRLKKIDATLSFANLDYDIITPKNLSELENYKIIVVPSLEMMSREETDAIRDFVLKGGNLYISGVSSLRDDKGNLHGNFMLSDVMGIDYQGEFEVQPSYIAPESEYSYLFGKHTKKYPHMLEEKFVKVLSKGEGKLVAKVSLPVSDTKDHLVFSSAISNPPIVSTDYPAIYENSYGKGKVIYSAGVIEEDQFVSNRELFTNLLKYLLKTERVELFAPKCVDHTVYESEKGLKINLLNSQTLYPPIPILDIHLKIRVNKKIKSVSDISGGSMKWKLEGDLLCIDTDLGVFKLIVVEFY